MQCIKNKNSFIARFINLLIIVSFIVTGSCSFPERTQITSNHNNCYDNKNHLETEKWNLSPSSLMNEGLPFPVKNFSLTNEITAITKAVSSEKIKVPDQLSTKISLKKRWFKNFVSYLFNLKRAAVFFVILSFLQVDLSKIAYYFISDFTGEVLSTSYLYHANATELSIIESLNVISNNNYVLSNVQRNMTPYTDRTYPLTNYPAILENAVIIRSAMNDKYVSEYDEILNFNVTEDSYIFVAYDKRIIDAGNIPEFLLEFEMTDMTTTVQEASGSNTQLLFKKKLLAGESINLYGNQFEYTNYFTIVVEASKIDTPGLLDNLQIFSTNLYEVADVQQGILPFTDRTYPLISYPAIFENTTIIRSAMDDKYISEYDEIMNFTVTEDSYVFVAYDKRIIDAGNIPEFLLEFEMTDMTTTVQEASGSNTQMLFKKKLLAGETISLFGNQFAYTNYFTVVVEASKIETQTLIDNLQSISSNFYAVAPIEQDMLAYTDRSYLLVDFPSVFNDAFIIRSPMDDKYVSENEEVVSFSVIEDSYIFVAYDKRILDDGYFPDFLSGYEMTDMTTTVEEAGGLPNTQVLFKKKLLAGEATFLYGNQYGYANYFTIVVETSQIDEISNSPISDLETISINAYETTSLSQHMKPYTDMDLITVVDFPTEMDGAFMISSPDDDNDIYDENLVYFNAKEDIDVYVAYSKLLIDNGQVPDFLNDFERTWFSIVLDNDGTLETMVLYKKTYNAGETVSLNGNQYGHLNYFTLITPAGSIEDKAISAYENFNVNSARSYTFLDAVLDIQAYTDRTYTISNMPDELENSTFLRPAMDDKYITNPDMIRFDVNVTSDVYVAYDKRSLDAGNFPDFLSNFYMTDETVSIDENGADNALVLFKRRFFPGEEVILGGNAYGFTNYLVFVKEISSAEISSINQSLKIYKKGTRLTIKKFDISSDTHIQDYEIFVDTEFVPVDSEMNFNSNKAKLMWDANGDADSYMLYVLKGNHDAASNLFSEFEEVPSGDATSWPIFADGPGEWTFAIKAFNECGNSSDFSNTATYLVTEEDYYGNYYMMIVGQDSSMLILKYEKKTDSFSIVSESEYDQFLNDREIHSPLASITKNNPFLIAA